VRQTPSATRKIKERAAELGIDGIGVCDSGVLAGTRKEFGIAINRGLIPQSQAPSSRTLVRLTTPATHLRGARAVISAYESYYTGEPGCSDPAEGVIAHYTRANYYHDLKLRLRRLSDFMRKDFGCRTKVFSCYVTLAEKPLARKAGLGFYGKNGVIVTERHGSFVVLGEIITDLELEPDPMLDMTCGSCRLCMDACPTGAIPAPYMVNRNLCIQYLSERRCIIPLKTRDAWRNRLYGCTTCQDVCPHNRNLPATSRSVSYGRVGASLPLRDVLLMDERQFQSRFAENQIGMREPNAIRRNAVIAAGNSQSPRFLSLLTTLATEPDYVIRQHSLWAIWRIRGPASRSLLESVLRTEKVPAITDEIKTLLDGFGCVA
jgi:epoxyqueuosine reductase